MVISLSVEEDLDIAESSVATSVAARAALRKS
jgi:hypothetical protein